MDNVKLFRIAGWCALAGALSMLGGVISFMIVPMLGGILEILFLLLIIVVFYTLSILHRSESKILSLAGLLLGIAAIIVDLFSMQNLSNVILSNLWYLLFSLPFLIFGFLALRSTAMPRGIAWVSMATGAIYLVSGIIGFLGNAAASDNISSVAILTLLVWLIWLWRVFFSKRLAVNPTLQV